MSRPHNWGVGRAFVAPGSRPYICFIATRRARSGTATEGHAMLFRKLFARKNPRPVATPDRDKPGTIDVTLNPIALLVKGATRKGF